MTKKSFAVFAREGSGCVRNGFEEFVEGSRVVLSDNGFQLGESHLNGIEIGTISWQVAQARANALECFGNPRDFMAAEVVADHNIAGA